MSGFSQEISVPHTDLSKQRLLREYFGVLIGVAVPRFTQISHTQGQQFTKN